MNQIVTRGIILSRTDYGEADRIITMLTPDYCKVVLLARGVRRIKSKIAGSIELFSVSEITFVKGRGEVGTLISARLIKHYDRIVTDINRTMMGYEVIKKLKKIIEFDPESDYFDLLEQTFEALNNDAISLEIVDFWLAMNLLRLGGRSPNLKIDELGEPLKLEKKYNFNLEKTVFAEHPEGRFNSQHIKFMRLCLSGATARVLAQVEGAEDLIADCSQLVTLITRQIM